MNRKKILVVCGGQSQEHEVSLVSARNVVANLLQAGCRVSVIMISLAGHWQLWPSSEAFLSNDRANLEPVLLAPGFGRQSIVKRGGEPLSVDVIFPVLHGPMGEDGVMQGLFSALGLPYVGSGVLGSAVCMDKVMTNTLLKAAGFKVGEFAVLDATDDLPMTFHALQSRWNVPIWIKPARMGSSLGIGRAYEVKEFIRLVAEAKQYDDKILLEASVQGREIECAVLGGCPPTAAVPGEIKIDSHFYDYDAKYVSKDAAKLEVPADLSPKVIRAIRDQAVSVFKTLECRGMARVDFFVTQKNEIYVNEVNTIPGFTPISLYPRMWEAAGLSQEALVLKLVELAEDEHALNQTLAMVE